MVDGRIDFNVRRMSLRMVSPFFPLYGSMRRCFDGIVVSEELGCVSGGGGGGLKWFCLTELKI